MRLSLTLCLLASYVAAAGSSPQSTDIYGKWSSPINVGPPVNSEHNDNYAILSRDELTMYSPRIVPEALEEMTCGLRHALRSKIPGETPRTCPRSIARLRIRSRCFPPTST